MNNTSAADCNTVASATTSTICPGAVWRGRHNDNRSKVIELIDTADPGRIRTRDTTSGRQSTISEATLRAKYEPVGSHVEAATPSASTSDQADEALQDAGARPSGAELVRVEGVPLYTHIQRPGLVTVRDIDLGIRAGLSRPRGIRPTIKAAIEDGAIVLSNRDDGAGVTAPFRDERRPLVYLVPTDVPSGNGTPQRVNEYHLSERAMIVVLARLRTTKAAELQQQIADAIVLLRQGRTAEASRVVGGPAPQASEIDRAIELVGEAEEEGILDSRTACLHRIDLFRRGKGIDLTRPPPGEIEQARPSERVAAAVEQLGPGESLRISRDVDESGTYSMEAIGRDVGLGAWIVGVVGRALGVHGDTGCGAEFGVFVPVEINGRKKRDNWRFSEVARRRMLPVLTAVANRRRANPSQGIRKLVSAVVAEWQATTAEPPAVAGAQGTLPTVARGNTSNAAE